MTALRLTFVLILAIKALGASGAAPANQLPGDRMLTDYFRRETAQLADGCLAEVRTLDDWQTKRAEFRRQLQEMLGLWPLPERTGLKPVITGRLEQEDFVLEKLHFQASPHLYVTANLYLPKNLSRPAPTILYACGHSRQFTNGVSYGNKVGYQHHGAWFARNGYVCLVIDSLQLGEIEGLHHGTSRFGNWWWNARGYTPAGVEAWFGIRALDYLCTRPEVDPNRIGMTGRSGGGSYSWTVAALDDRIKVVAPVAGITDLENHVVDGCVEGHCDCMFFMNTYRWDFPLVAALIAPRPLLIVNTDKDKIFPLDGALRVHQKTRRIYELHGKPENLGLVIADGPHADTQDLQVPVFRWFNRWLKQSDPLIEMAAKKFFPTEALRVFERLPADEVNTRIQESFGPPAEKPLDRRKLAVELQGKVFAGWPKSEPSLPARLVFASERDGARLRAWEITCQEDWRLRFYLLDAAELPATAPLILENVDQADWKGWLAGMRSAFEPELAAEVSCLRTNPPPDLERYRQWMTGVKQGNRLAWFAPRGVGLSAWSGNPKQQAQIRRRFMLLGQTLDGMRVWDIRNAIHASSAVVATPRDRITLHGHGEMGVNALYAALFEPEIRVELAELPDSHLTGPDYLNVLRFADIPEVFKLVTQSDFPRQ